MINDPVDLAVKEHRAKVRAASTLKATKNIGLMKQPVFFTSKSLVDTSKMIPRGKTSEAPKREGGSKFLSSLRENNAALLIPNQPQEANTANDVIPRKSAEGTFTQTISEQN